MGDFLRRFFLLASMMLALGACQDSELSRSTRSIAPVPPRTLSLMQEKGTSKEAPTLIRSFKKESELEIWKMTQGGQYALLKTYPICRWSGQLGPKVREGDRQAPEGFYEITPAAMNPNSSLYLSFNMGYPNAYDRTYGRTGAHLMVHGACSSAGCYAMSDEQISEIYAILRESFAGGQKSVQMQALPFRMTPENLAKHRLDPNVAFWRNLKEGSDRFELASHEPKVGVCGRRYVFDARVGNTGANLDPVAACPTLKGDDELSLAVARKVQADEKQVADLVAQGTKAVRVAYSDGSQHTSFRAPSSAFGASGSTMRLVDVSRPEALERAPQEIEVEAAGSKARYEPKTTKGPASAPRTPASVRAVRAEPRRMADNSLDPEQFVATAPAATPPARGLLSSWAGALLAGKESHSPPRP